MKLTKEQERLLATHFPDAFRGLRYAQLRDKKAKLEAQLVAINLEMASLVLAMREKESENEK